MFLNRPEITVQCYFLDLFQLVALQLLCSASRPKCVGSNRVACHVYTVECGRQYCSLATGLQIVAIVFFQLVSLFDKYMLTLASNMINFTLPYNRGIQ